jgi:glutathione S-transferase
MKFYDFPSAPSPRKVRLFLAEKGLELPTIEVNLRDRAQHDPAFLALNPGATVPVLELDDGTCLTESLAIVQYLEEFQREPNLMGRTPRERALVLMWNDIQTLEGYTALQEALRNGHPAFADRPLPGVVPYPQIPALAERGRKRAAVFFDKLEGRLSNREFIATESFTYADIVGFVYTAFAERALGDPPTSSRPALNAWYRRMAARPATAASL